MADLSQYLRERELLEPFQPDTADQNNAGEQASDPLFDDEDMLSRVAGMWNDHQNPMKTVLRRRIKKMRDELVVSARPEEVMVIRQSMMEVAAILDDFYQASEEYERRRKEREQPADDEAAEGTNHDNNEETSAL